jgi:hypothetical protein
LLDEKNGGLLDATGSEVRAASTAIRRTFAQLTVTWPRRTTSVPRRLAVGCQTRVPPCAHEPRHA